MLNIYKASAGSGKTFRLTFEYIKMLLGYYDVDSKEYKFHLHYNNMHRRILAVTFTNKATQEMKDRIVKELNLLAHDIDESKHTTRLCETFKCSKDVLQNNVNVVLLQLLHDFSFFNVSTIDRFFQQVLRNFTREVGLYGGFELELDDKYITRLAIDRMFDDLENDDETFEWLLRYNEENIINNGSWNLHNSKDIEDLAKQLTTEEYKKYREKLANIDLEHFNNYVNQMKELQKGCLTKIREKTEEVLDFIATEGIDHDWFSGKWVKFFLQLTDPNLNVVSCKEIFEKITNKVQNVGGGGSWFAKTNMKKANRTPEECLKLLFPIVEEYHEYVSGIFRDLDNISVCLKNIYAFGVLSTIDGNVAKYERENNTLLLSKTPELLSGLINKSDAPFIYERVGTRIMHYMIDEFQDTSKLQWENFRPLVEESMGHHYENLIVGDVKQSIYRFRNSDWQLLHSSLDCYNPTDLSQDYDTNWRSCYNVVNFNNGFFSEAPKIMSREFAGKLRAAQITMSTDILKNIYTKVAQKVSPKKQDQGGRVAFYLFEQDQYKNQINLHIAGIIKDLFARGYRQRDIAFLAYRGEECRSIIKLLLNLGQEGEGDMRDIKVISDDSLLVSSAAPVKLIIGVLQYLQNPLLPVNRLTLAYQYATNKGQVSSEALADYLKDNELPEELQTFIKRIANKPLFEMCECIIKEFGLNKDTSYIPYIEAFQDVIIEFCAKNASDLYSFLRWWKSHEDKLIVKSPNNIDAITVMTIHKSKGLEFPAVIIPYATWSMCVNAVDKWHEPTCEPYNAMPVLPITHDASIERTIFAKEYYEEMMRSYIDNINKTYVAFTRAKQELIVFTQHQGSDTIGNVIEQALNSKIELEDTTCAVLNLGDYKKECDGYTLYEVGEGWQMLHDDDDNNAASVEMSYEVTLPETLQLKQRVGSAEARGASRREYGILMHNIMSEIAYKDDVAHVVQRYVREGRIKQSQAENIINKLVKHISKPEVAHWFANDMTIVNESDILKSGKKISRPDRVVIDRNNNVVVIDYKFGRKELDSYRTKVSEYVQAVREMGYEHVEGYLWYVDLNKLEPVA